MGSRFIRNKIVQHQILGGDGVIETHILSSCHQPPVECTGQQTSFTSCKFLSLRQVDHRNHFQSHFTTAGKLRGVEADFQNVVNDFGEEGHVFTTGNPSGVHVPSEISNLLKFTFDGSKTRDNITDVQSLQMLNHIVITLNFGIHFLSRIRKVLRDVATSASQITCCASTLHLQHMGEQRQFGHRIDNFIQNFGIRVFRIVLGS